MPAICAKPVRPVWPSPGHHCHPTFAAWAGPGVRVLDGGFRTVRKLIYQHAGISLSPVKRDMVYSPWPPPAGNRQTSLADYLDATGEERWR